jgi:HAD superfamily hydrolase (TIGR01509 family)
VLGEDYDRAWLAEVNDSGITPRPEFLAAVRERYGLDAPVATLLEDYRRLTWEHMPRVAPDAAARLEALRAAGWKVAIVTNGEPGPQAATIERAGLTELIDACVVSGAVGVRKPDPRILEIAARETGVALDGAWMIGDGEADVGAAVAAPGVTAVWLSLGRTWTRTDLAPDHVAPTLAEALALVS